MILYRYPAGAEINGHILAEPTVLAPCLAVIETYVDAGAQPVQHGPEICALWSPEALADLGIKRVECDPLPVDETGWPYLPGAPVDVEEAEVIRRTYPNAVPDVDGSAANLAQLGASIRVQRDAKLAVCDWTQLPDAPLSAAGKTAWGTYRQALRDVPEQTGFPANVAWPVAPGA